MKRKEHIKQRRQELKVSVRKKLARRRQLKEKLHKKEEK